MKVWIVPSWYIREDSPLDGLFFREQAQALMEAGVQVCVLYADARFRPGRLRKGLYRAADEVPTFVCRRRSLVPYWERGRHMQKARMLEALYRAAEREFGRPDIIHLHSCRAGPETLRLCRRHGLPLVYTEHYSGVMRESLPSGLREEFDRTLAGCDRAIAVSSALRARMLRRRPDTFCVPDMVDTRVFRILPQEDAPGTVFAAMGNLLSVKNFGLLLRAFARALPELPGASLVIAGDGPQRETLEAQIGRLGLSGRARLCGSVPHVEAPAFYGRCDCLVCSSVIETFGMTLVEALACGRPVIATRCGGPSDIVTARNGMLVEPGDAEAMARAMIEMARGRGRYDRAAIRRECEQAFGRAAVTARLCGIYQDLLRQSPREGKGAKDRL